MSVPDNQAVLQAMATAIPSHPRGDTTSDVSSSLELIALAVHAVATASGLHLISLDEDKKTEAECISTAPRLPATWNSSIKSHTFVYDAESVAELVVIRVDRMGAKMEIRGVTEQGEDTYRLEVKARDIVKSAGLPLRIRMNDQGEEDRSGLAEALADAFISQDAFHAFSSEIHTRVINNLLSPTYQKVHTATVAEPSRLQESTGRVEPSQPPDAILPRSIDDPHGPVDPSALPTPYPAPDILDAPRNIPRPIPAGELVPPGFDDEHEIQGPLRPLAGGGSGIRADRTGGLGMGHDDLSPPGLGPEDPLRQSFTPGRGLGRQTGGHRGMHPTMDELMYPGQDGEFGGMGDGVFPDELQAPPGARWDPTGPGGRPGWGRGNGRGFGGGSGGGYGGGFGGFGGNII